MLEEKLTMYYYDHRGSGSSESPSNKDFSLARMAEDIEDTTRMSDKPKVYLLAHSFGGMLTSSYTDIPRPRGGTNLLNAPL